MVDTARTRSGTSQAGTGTYLIGPGTLSLSLSKSVNTFFFLVIFDVIHSVLLLFPTEVTRKEACLHILDAF